MRLFVWGPIPGFLDKVYAGPDESLRSYYEWRTLLFVTLPIMFSAWQGIGRDPVRDVGDAAGRGRPMACWRWRWRWVRRRPSCDKHDARLIVVGTYGDSPMRGAILGSTPHKLLHWSSRPVLCVPPPAAEE